MIELRVLGTLDLRDTAHGRPITAVLAQPKRTGVLAYLAAATPRGPHRRETLLLLFWPNATEERARNSLNQAVFNLRRSLGEAAVLGAGEEIRIGSDVIWCDAVEFDEALAAGDIRHALALYGGDLLPGFHLDACIEFDRWLTVERERLRSKAVAAALALAAEEERSGNGVAAVELLRRAIAWSPYDEPAVLALVKLLAQLGDRAGALREYERFRALLETEMSLSPSSELEGLVRQIQRDAIPHGGRTAERQPGTIGSVNATEFGHSPGESVAPVPAKPSRLLERLRTRSRAAVLALVLSITAVGVFAGSRIGRSAASSGEIPIDARRVLVAAFENQTGDATLDPLTYMAADWIAQGLARTGIARVVPFSTVVQETPFLRAEGSAPEVAVPTANRQFARRVGAGILIRGTYYRTGDSLAFQAQIIDVASGELLRAIDEVRGLAAKPADAMEELQRRSLGAMATLLDARLESWPDPGGQPSSIEAYRLFSDGMTSFMRGMHDFASPARLPLFTAAADKFEAAASLDSAFIVPLLWAAYARVNAGATDAARAIVHRVEQRPLSQWNRAVTNHLAAGLAGDLEAQYQASRELAELSPDSEWLSKLARGAFLTGRFREALAVYERLDTRRGWLKGWSGYWGLRVEVQHAIGDYHAALRDARRGLAAQRSDDWLGTQELWALAALGRLDDVSALLRPRIEAGEPRAVWQLNTTLEELLGHGRTAAATRLVREMIPLAQGWTARAASRGARSDFAYLLYLSGRNEEAASLYAKLLRERPGAPEARVRAALLAARRGDRNAALETLNWLSTLPEDTLAATFPQRQFGYWGSVEGWGALLQARLLTQLGERDRAVEMLHEAVARRLAHTYLHLHDDPDFEPLRRHPRFQALLRPRT